MHWWLNGALLLLAQQSILQNQGKNEVLPVLPKKAPLYYMQPNDISSNLMQGYHREEMDTRTINAF